MDFGVVGLDGLVGSDIGFPSFSSASDPVTKQIKLYGSSSTSLLQKQERSISTVEDDWRSSKMAKSNDGFTASKGMPFLEQQQQQMLCFSSPKSDSSVPYNYSSSPACNRSSGNNNYGSMSYGGGGVHATSSLTGVKGPFSPSQWMELEHQALIFKYIATNAPIPSNLLFPIISRKALESATLSSFSGQFFRPNNSSGWGPFHVGFSNNNDPEPGRCRRTDGKKWRCSRDAVSDQKYCERHLNRGRHRSRKPVEGRQVGHSVASGPTTTTSDSKLITATSASTMVGPGSATASNSLPPITNPNHHHEQFKNMNRMFMTEENNDMKFKLNVNHPVSIQKQQMQYDWSSQKTESQNPLHQFFNNWPNSDTRSDSTQLSISIPMHSSSPHAEEKLALSPLRLASNVVSESNWKQGANWIPISWGGSSSSSSSSMGGPLGEVLHPTATTNNNSPSLGSSPTGVLQRTAFGSLSNSSAGSSPRPENKRCYDGGASFCNDLLGQLL